MILTGGIAVRSVKWIDTRTLRVAFDSVHTGRHHQLYAGRELVGVTSSTSDRQISARLSFVDRPIPLRVVALIDEATNVAGGDRLPPRAFNRPRVDFDTSGLEADASEVEISIGPSDNVPAGLEAVDAVPVMPTRPQRSVLLPPQATGDYTVRLTPYDNREGGGNAGTPSNVTVSVASLPKDLVERGSGERFDAVSVAGTLTVTAELPAEM